MVGLAQFLYHRYGLGQSHHARFVLQAALMHRIVLNIPGAAHAADRTYARMF
jgi:hypothetical protein